MRKTAHLNRPVIVRSFVVHVWKERIAARRFVWRGSLTNVHSGSTKYFQSLPVLAKLLAKAVEINPKENGS